jgi:hypothetical protein
VRDRMKRSTETDRNIASNVRLDESKDSRAQQILNKRTNSSMLSSGLDIAHLPKSWTRPSEASRNDCVSTPVFKMGTSAKDLLQVQKQLVRSTWENVVA